MRSRQIIIRRIITVAVFLSLYVLVKIVVVFNSERLNDHSKVEEETYTSPHQDDTSWKVNIQRNQSLDSSNCSSGHLEAPHHVKSMGCSGKDARFCEVLTCRNLLSGTDPKVYDMAKAFMDKHLKKIKTNREIGELAKNCGSFKQSRGYKLTILSQDTADFPIAFNILVHKNVAQMERLLRAIYRPQNIYCIHIDRKANQDLVDAVTKIAECFDNVFVASRLEKIIYAGYSRLKADINCMEDHVKQTSVRWKYLMNLAAQAFPLLTPEEMVKVLRIYNGSNDIEGIYGRRILRFRFESEWEERIETLSVNKTGKSHGSPPHDLDIVRGSAFGIFSRPFVEFILKDQRAHDLLEWSKRTYSPDEHYWATLHHTYTNPHLHTPGGFSGPPGDKPWLAVFVKWGLDSKCHGKFVRGVCILGVGDLPDLIVRKEFFVNKFYDDFQPLALDCLEAWLQHKEICPVPFDEEYYKSLPFVRKY